jgi:hypothetical protein
MLNPLFGQAQKGLSQPLDFSQGRDALVDAMYRRSTRLLDPRFKQGENDVRTDLANRGFSLGDAGYDRAMGDFNRSKEFAYGQAQDQAMTGGAQQRMGEILAERQTPLNELNTVRSMGSGFQPYACAGQVQAAPVFAGAQATGNAEMQRFGVNADMYNNMMSGLFGMGSAGMKGGAKTAPGAV